MVDLQQNSGLQILEEKLQKREYLDCIELAKKILDGTQSADQQAAAKIKLACYIAIGDANFGLKRFQDALLQYERARKLAEEKNGALSEESMHTLFRLERALRALAELEGGGNTKNVLTSTVLLTAQSSEAASQLASGRHARTLQGIWALALDKKITKESNPFVSLIQTVMQKLGSARVEEFLARVSITVSVAGMVCMLIYAAYWWQTHPYPTVANPISHDDFRAVNQTHCPSKTLKWPFKTFDGASTLAWSQDGTAEFTGIGGSHGRLPVVIYDGSPGSVCGVLFAIWTQNNLLLRWNGYALQDQNDTTYYDISEPENTVVAKIYALRNWAQDFFKKRGRYPSAADHNDLNYTNPITKHTERILLITGKENVVGLMEACKVQGIVPHGGMIVCVSAGPRKFLIGAFDRARNPVQTSNAHDGVLALNANQKPSAPPAANKSKGMIVFDKPIDQLSYLLCAHTAFAGILFVLLLGAVGPAIFLLTKNWRTALRAKKKPHTRSLTASPESAKISHS
jgi:hypothetical protein